MILASSVRRSRLSFGSKSAQHRACVLRNDDDDDDDDRFSIALFSAVEQTRCAFVACDSKRVIVAFI